MLDTSPRIHRNLLATVLIVFVASAAVADEVTSKGTVLRGTITAISGAGITFEPEYGKGALTMKWKDIEDVRSEVPFQVLYGLNEEQDGPLNGLSNGNLTVGTVAIDSTSILQGLPIGAAGLSFKDRLRSNWRYWHGNLDAGFNLQQSTTDTTGFVFAFKTTRTKDPTRLILGASYRYGTQSQSGQPTTRTLDQLLGLVRGEYDFTPRVYGYASGDATYDGIQHLSIRGVPKAGIGYIFWEEQLDESRRNFLQGDVGGSWVYEKYFGGMERDYVAIAFGAQAGYYFIQAAHFDWRMDYLPAVDNFTTDYLLRNEIGLSVPLLDPLSAKFGLLDEYDGQPAPGAKHNSLFLTFGLSVVW